MKLISDEQAARKKELDTTLGEIPLIFCPIPNCPTHTNQTNQSVNVVTNPGARNTENEINPKPSNDMNNAKEKASKKNTDQC
ncbi:hypothetical protein TNCV_131211 [Trichonephila clavipes]|nr:hypothetical protein TNCV_131211 [Trichonephila clavipes]